ncbi:MAG: endo-1,4-beta-xylanase [Planctomycetota bacterium]
MLRFVVFDRDGPAQTWPIRHAHLFGADDVPVPGTVRFEGSCVVGERSTSEAAGISLQYRPAEVTSPDAVEAIAGADPGVITLRTCLLPDRDAPYLLSLELARHRIMLFLNKIEEWELFDLPPEDPVMGLFETARQMFTRALVAQRESDGHPSMAGFSWHADQLARASLTLAIEAGEKLSLRYAADSLAQRASGKTYAHAAEQYQLAANEPPPPDVPIILPSSIGVVMPGRPMLGVTVNPRDFGEPAKKAVGELADFVCMPLRWRDMEPKEGAYAFQPTDRWIEWAVRKAKMPVVAGPVIDFRRSCIPEWLYIWENDYETLRELVYEHVRHIVTRYRRTVRRWTVASGLHVNTNFTFTFDQMMDLTRVCVLMVRKLHPHAKIQLEITQPWGEYYGHNRRSLPPLLYAEMVAQAGVGVDAYALRLQFGQHAAGQSSRDLMALSTLLDRYAAVLEKPLAITAVGAPSAPSRSETDPDLEPGYWRQPWSERSQAAWIDAALSVCAGKPYIHSVCWQDLADAPNAADAPEMPHGGLIHSTGDFKPAAEAFRAVRDHARGPRAGV